MAGSQPAVRGSFSGFEKGAHLLQGMIGEVDFGSADDIVGFAVRIDHMLRWIQRDGQGTVRSRS